MKGVTGVSNKLGVVPTPTYEDEKIAKDVANALDRNIIMDRDNINVTVEQGVAILTGTVTSWSAKRAAYYAAQYTRGVKEVSNQILVSSA